MSIMGRRVPVKAVAAIAVLFVAVVGLLPVMSKGRGREITLVARDMAFYVEGNSKNANPIIEVRPGETIRITLRNRDRGMTHDFAVPAADAATKTLSWNEQDELVFDAPAKPGTYEYICRPHVLMMRGAFRVVE